MMKTRATPLAPEFQKGQTWNLGAGRIEISLVGKWLVHYRHFSGRNKRPPTSFIAKDELGRMLIQHEAVLVQN